MPKYANQIFSVDNYMLVSDKNIYNNNLLNYLLKIMINQF